MPAWLLNSHEWASITSASPKVQRPILIDGLRNLRTGNPMEVGREHLLSRFCRNHLVLLRASKADVRSYTAFGPRQGFGKTLKTIQEGLEGYKGTEVAGEQLDVLIEQVDAVISDRTGWEDKFDPFSEPDIDQIIGSLEEVLAELPATSDIPMGNEDLPLQFDADLFADQVETVASFSEAEDASRYIGGLKLRIRSLLNDERIRPIMMPEDQPHLVEWLDEFLGDGDGTSLAVIDLSLVPSDVVELVVAVMGRMVFEALQRHRRLQKKALPTALVLEEAHAFVRSHSHSDEFPSPGEMCVRTFERISREGRKFGLGLVIASQRPSELSPTILAQCNSFLLHRLVNDRDQQLVGKLVPDNLSGLLEDLPSLPTRHALLIGWAAVLPTLLEVRELPEEQRPQSDDPDFWNVWIRAADRDVAWGAVVKDWIGSGGDG